MLFFIYEICSCNSAHVYYIASFIVIILIILWVYYNE